MANTTPHKITETEIKAYVLRYGLTNLTDEHLSRLVEIADVVAEVGRKIPRVPAKGDEPAHVFRVPLK